MLYGSVMHSPCRHIEVSIQFSVSNTGTINQLSASKRSGIECMCQEEKSNECWKNKYTKWVENDDDDKRQQQQQTQSAAWSSELIFAFLLLICFNLWVRVCGWLSVSIVIILHIEMIVRCWRSAERSGRDHDVAWTAYKSNKSHRMFEYTFWCTLILRSISHPWHCLFGHSRFHARFVLDVVFISFLTLLPS